LNDLPENSRRDNMRYALFVGCTVAYKLPHIEAATRYVMDALGRSPLFLLPGSKWGPLLQL
jgi:Fe-S oxidoreductase